ncbi:MAG: pyridoxal phosphate-dependent aminotransferase family protein, partial [Leptospirales bacterium]
TLSSFDTKPLIDFSSNDYLGLTKNKKLTTLTKKNFNKHFPEPLNGSGASRLLSGNFSFFETSENLIAQYHNSEAALLFNSGYVANLGLFSCIATRHDIILYDELSHASIRDGIRLNNAKSFSFKHNNLEHLKQKIDSLIHKSVQRIFVVVESLYSMDGDCPDLGELLEICEISGKNHPCYLIVDEAHAAGIYGLSGRGLANLYAEHPNLFARIITYGKAFGLHGAAICCSNSLRDYLINFSRPFIYTTAASPESICAIYTAYEMMPDLDREREKLFENIHLFVENLCTGSKTDETETKLMSKFSQIQTIQIPGNENVKSICTVIQKSGYDVRPIVSPTVPVTKERIRICIHSFNTQKDILQVAALLKPHAK